MRSVLCTLPKCVVITYMGLLLLHHPKHFLGCYMATRPRRAPCPHLQLFGLLAGTVCRWLRWPYELVSLYTPHCEAQLC